MFLRRQNQVLLRELKALRESVDQVSVDLHAQRAKEQQQSPRYVSSTPAYISLAAIVLGAITATYSLIAFNEPVLSEDYSSSYTFGVASATVANVGIKSYYLGPSVSYSMEFPEVMAGDSWVLILEGDAEISSLSGATSKGISMREDRCDGSTRINCEIISGTVPAKASLPSIASFTRSVDNANCGQDFFAKESSRYAIRVGGDRKHMHGTHTWAYREDDLPVYTILNTPAVTNLRDFEASITAKVSRTYKNPILDHCIAYLVNDNYEVVSTNPNPSEVFSRDVVTWTNKDAEWPSILLRKTWAASAGNAGIILAGLCFTLVGGFLPVYVQDLITARRGRPRKTRRRHRRTRDK